MSEVVFRDYSTYLQRIVRLEKKAHEQCNNKMYGDAQATLRQIVCEANALREWLKDQPEEC